LGVIARLTDAGIDVRPADLLVGTSAGAVVSSQLTSDLTLEELFERQIDRGLNRLSFPS
jgi:NTE family protein